MYLMVYFHHKSIIYEEMLLRYLTSKDCTFNLPASIQEYTFFNDHKLYENLAHSQNEWAQRISQQKPLKVLLELHNNQQANQIEKLKNGALVVVLKDNKLLINSLINILFITRMTS